MLTCLHEALHTHFAALSLPVWQEDCIPDGTAFPYLTLRVTPAASFGGTGEVCVTAWVRSPAAHSDRLALADRLLAVVPAAGLLLKTSEGLVTLWRREDESIRFCEDHDALSAQMRFDLRIYPTH